MKIFFFGSDKYSQIVLDSLRQDRRFEIARVIHDKKSLNEILSLPKPDVGILASFGAILPKEILEFPRHGILNIHPSLLPKYRGPSPIQTAILNGEKETGVTIINMDEQIDHGPIVAQFSEEILPSDTAESLYLRLFSAGAKIIKTILPGYLDGRIELREQNHKKATYTQKLSRTDGKVDWQKPAEFLDRQIRAFYPWPGSWTEISLPVRKANTIPDRKRLKILKAHLENDKLVLDLVQLEGKKPVTWQQFQEGYPGTELTFME